MENEPRGQISDIQRCCVSDGPGIRTTVFLQGCPLHCPWCHNPEFRSFRPLHSFRPERCINCGRCRNPAGGFHCVRTPGNVCSGCGLCERECPAGALTVWGKTVSVAEVMQVIRRDLYYYRETGGGLTLSGGEPLAQRAFSLALLQAAKAEAITTAVETSGAVPPEILPGIARFCDLFLFDIKTIPERYPVLAGIAWERIRQNLQILSDSGARIRLRTPVVQGWNDDPSLPELLHELRQLPGVEEVELLPCHPLGRGKAAAAGLPEPDWEHMAAPPETLLNEWRDIIRS